MIHQYRGSLSFCHGSNADPTRFIKMFSPHYFGPLSSDRSYCFIKNVIWNVNKGLDTERRSNEQPEPHCRALDCNYWQSDFSVPHFFSFFNLSVTQSDHNDMYGLRPLSHCSTQYFTKNLVSPLFLSLKIEALLITGRCVVPLLFKRAKQTTKNGISKVFSEFMLLTRLLLLKLNNLNTKLSTVVGFWLEKDLVLLKKILPTAYCEMKKLSLSLLKISNF